jgi:uncharacterized membrane protein YgcG
MSAPPSSAPADASSSSSSSNPTASNTFAIILYSVVGAFLFSICIIFAVVMMVLARKKRSSKINPRMKRGGDSSSKKGRTLKYRREVDLENQRSATRMLERSQLATWISWILRMTESRKQIDESSLLASSSYDADSSHSPHDGLFALEDERIPSYRSNNSSSHSNPSSPSSNHSSSFSR